MLDMSPSCLHGRINVPALPWVVTPAKPFVKHMLNLLIINVQPLSFHYIVLLKLDVMSEYILKTEC